MEVRMLAKFPRFGVTLIAFQALLLCWLFYSYYHKGELITACRHNSERTLRIEAQVADAEAQLDKQEADLTAAEARLNNKQ
jgi:hypothetical protein